MSSNPVSKYSNLIWNLFSLACLYPVNINLNYWWNYGVLAFFCLCLQILTGIFLAMYFIADAETSFQAVEYIMRNVNYGWLVRYLHANGASFFFLVVYIHVFRNIFYNNFLFPKEKVWGTGVILLFLMILTAFLGYVLPWGQMSFWAATVITNLVSVVPFLGATLIVWLWGGYAIDNATLNRFFSFHFIFPFIICIFVFLHVYFLHEVHSSSPDTLLYFTRSKISFVSFYPYYVIKDLVGLQIFLIFFSIIVFFYPNVLGHSDNYIVANPLMTPSHIVPEWYFLPFYALLRSVPDKLYGVLGLLSSLIILFILPWILSNLIKGSVFYKIMIFVFWIFVGTSLILGWIGQKSVEVEYLLVGRITGLVYFLYFIFFCEVIRYMNIYIAKRDSMAVIRYFVWLQHNGIGLKERMKIIESFSYFDRILDLLVVFVEAYTISYSIMISRWTKYKYYQFSKFITWLKKNIFVNK